MIGYTDGTTGVGSLHPKGRTDMAMPTAGELGDLTQRLRELANRAMRLSPDVLTINARGELVPVDEDESQLTE